MLTTVNILARHPHTIFKSHISRRFQNTQISEPHFGKLSLPSLRLILSDILLLSLHMHRSWRFSSALSLKCVDSLGYYLFCVGVHSVFQGGGNQFPLVHFTGIEGVFHILSNFIFRSFLRSFLPTAVS